MKKTKIDFKIEAIEQQDPITSGHVQSQEMVLDQSLDLGMLDAVSEFSAQEEPTQMDVQFEAYSKEVTNDASMNQGVAEDLLFHETTSDDGEMIIPQQSITGNLLDGDFKDGQLISIEQLNVDETANEDGVVEIIKEDGQGVLTVFTQELGEHQPGDFSYTLTQTHEASGHEHFTYVVEQPTGQVTLSVSFELSESGPKVGQPDMGFVDEVGLLPGEHESLETYGNLDIASIDEPDTSVKFAPLVLQQSLIDANITSDGTPLYYVLNEEGTHLSAYQGANGPLVFKVELFEDGSFHFKLDAHLDRDPQENLLNDPNFEMLGKQNAFIFDTPLGWHDHQSTLTNLSDKQSLDDELIVTQEVKTNIGEAFHLSMYMGTPNHGEGKIDLFWNDELIHTFEGEQPLTGYTFAVDSGYHRNSELKIVGHDLNQDLSHYLHDMMLSSMDMQKFPLEFKFNLYEGDEVVDYSFLKVNIATEPPIILNSSQPFNIVYEQALYQNIILNEQTMSDNSPLTTLDLEAMFDKLNIDDNNRQVDIVQLEENGQQTNIYEVQISDKGSTLDPITVADIRLMFPGGEQGLEVFYKNIQILDT